MVAQSKTGSTVAFCGSNSEVSSHLCDCFSCSADEDGVVACPVSVTLGYLQGVLPEGVASAWLVAIARRAFQLYVARLQALHRTQDQGQLYILAQDHFGDLGVIGGSAADKENWLWMSKCSATSIHGCELEYKACKISGLVEGTCMS